MKIITIIQKISFLIVISFSLFGMMVFSTVIHELSHKYQLREINTSNESICALNIKDKNDYFYSGAIGYYEFNYPLNESEKIEEIKKYSEHKAYASGIIIVIIFNIFLHIFLWERFKLIK